MTVASVNSSSLRLGTQGFAYKDWLGVFYPDPTPTSEYLSFYSRVFDTVELDTTFYGPPRPETLRAWRDSTPVGFIFTAKMPKVITHEWRLVKAEHDLVDFLTVMQLLGPILIQLPPSFTAEERPALARFLEILPEEFRYAVELRHRSWLEPSTAELLARHNVAWTIVDLVSMPIEVCLTTDFTYVRWLGNRSDVKHLNRTVVDRTADYDAWAQRLDTIAQRLQRIYGYVNNHYSGHSPASVNEIKRRARQPVIHPDELWGQQRLEL